ncbi:aKG-HExxH-type peptide beta-hydroxylase [Amycolatopsis sp. NPDC003731]
MVTGPSTCGELPTHHFSWADFDALARAESTPSQIPNLRAAERSRRLLLIRGIIDEATKAPELYEPLASPDSAWELLAKTEQAAPAALEAILAHPYTGSWAGYTIRLCRHDVSGVFPFWVHLGHLHSLAAAAAIRAGITFETSVPCWQGNVFLPTLGMAGLRSAQPFGVAHIRGRDGAFEVWNSAARVRVPSARTPDTEHWSGIREAVTWAGERRLAVKLDDVDPYRGLYGPIPPQRLDAATLESWRTVLDDAWRLLAGRVPEFAEAIQGGLDSLVPDPPVPFRLPSASTGEAFGSAIMAYGADPAQLAAALVHEFQHIRLGGLLHLVPLTVDDPRERLYAPWRPDPRPIGGVIHGIYAFFGVTAFWRAVAADDPENPLASFEFALWRAQTWRTVRAVRADESLTPAGRRFLGCVATRLSPWQHEPIHHHSAFLAGLAAQDHYAAWRARHLRPDPQLVASFADAWVGRRPPSFAGPLPEPGPPTPVPDGTWPDARTDLLRIRFGPGGGSALPARGPTVPGATSADVLFASGRYFEAADSYRQLLAANPDDPSALVGLGLAMAARSTGPATRALLHHPELVRAVHRLVRAAVTVPPSVEAVAGWLGKVVY